MPYLPDEELMEFVGSDLIQSDILNSVEAERGYAAANDSNVGPSVVAIEQDHQLDNESDQFVDVEQTMPTPALKKRGRPSLSRSETPAKTPAKTPRSTKKVATPKSSGRKRKAPEPEEQSEEEEAEEESEKVEEPAKKRGRPAARAAAVATTTRLTASKSTRGRAKSTTTATTDAAKPKGKGGRPRKADTNGDSTTAAEYEVEEIVDAAVDGPSKQHMYLVKWKGYPSSENTWEPKKNLSHASELIATFDAKNKEDSDKTEAAAPVAKRQKRETKAAAKVKPEKPTKKVAEAPKKAVGRPKSTRTRSG